MSKPEFIRILELIPSLAMVAGNELNDFVADAENWWVGDANLCNDIISSTVAGDQEIKAVNKYEELYPSLLLSYEVPRDSFHFTYATSVVGPRFPPAQVKLQTRHPTIDRTSTPCRREKSHIPIMRLIKSAIERKDGSGFATLLPEEPEDMV